jgi:CBS domain containing-hemolysin-like protein
MISFIIAILLLGLALGGVAVRKTYYQLPLPELKRRALRHDKVAEQLYQAAAYEGSLRGLLWLFIAGTSAAGFILLARQAPIWLSLIVVIVLLWAAFSWLPASRVSSFGARATATLTPFITWLLSYLHPIIIRIVGVVSKRYSAPAHTGLFERDDLMRLLEQQQGQVDSRLSIEELDIVRHVLSFPDHVVRDVLTPRGDIRTVHANETVGPILIDELHQTGLEHVLVQDSPNAEIVGTLAIHELGLHSSGRVRDIMDPTVYYVHESDSLSEALHAFFVTNHPLFIVTNSFEEYVGIITVQSILRQLLGHVPGDDFDRYSDLQAVANRHPRARRSKKAEDIAPEVVK